MALSYLLLFVCGISTANITFKPTIPTDWTYELPEITTHNSKCPTDQDNLQATTLNHWPRSNQNPDKDLFFAILFYDDPTDDLRHRVTINAAIDVAIQRVQARGGLLEGFNITTEYRDSQSSSLQGALAAWDLHYIYQPGS